MRLLFKGGTVVTGKGPRRADILVEGEKILDVCRDIPAIGAQVVDVTGILLFPGFIDAHTHFDLDVCNTTTADDFASGSRAALRGGTTTIIDFACPNKGETLHDGLRLWHEKADGKCACDYGFHMTIDDWNETIEREIDDMYAEQVDVPVVIVHTTNIEALDEIANARWRGQKVFVETCPQYLVLDDSVYYNEDWLQAAKYVCSPPIRKPADREALWRAIRRGEVQTVSTDHCSFTTQQKLAGRDDFTAIPGGIPGVETRGELIYTFGVAKKKIGLGAMCRVLAENPAKLYGLFPRKGVLAPGSDADIVVYDPNADHVIHAEDMVGAADYNPYEGVVTKGSIRQVWLRGKPAVSSGKVLAGPDGKYLPRGKCQL